MMNITEAVKYNKAIDDVMTKMLNLGAKLVECDIILEVTVSGPEEIRKKVYDTEMEISKGNTDIDFDFHFRCIK